MTICLKLTKYLAQTQLFFAATHISLIIPDRFLACLKQPVPVMESYTSCFRTDSQTPAYYSLKLYLFKLCIYFL